MESDRVKREGDEFEPEGAGRLSEGSDTLVRASRSRDFVRATSRGLCLSNGLFRSNSFDSTVHHSCSLSFKLPRHFFFSFKKSKRKIFHTIIYNMFVRNRRNFWNSRVCVYIWITFEGTNKLHQFETESSAIRRAVHVEKSRIMTKVRQYRFLPLLVHILLGGKFENIPFSSSHRSDWNVSFFPFYFLLFSILFSFFVSNITK